MFLIQRLKYFCDKYDAMPTSTCGLCDDLPDGRQRVKVAHLEDVLFVWLVGNLTQLLIVDVVTDSDGEQVDVVVSSLGGRACRGVPPVGIAVCKYDGNLRGFVRTSAIARGEAVDDLVDGPCGVGAAVFLFHPAHCVNDVLLGDVGIKVELQVRDVTEREHTNTCSLPRDVKLLHHRLEEIDLLGEIGRPDTAGRIHHKHDVHFSVPDAV